jgi:hypothetical protein
VKKSGFLTESPDGEMFVGDTLVRGGGILRFLFGSWVEEFVFKNAVCMTGAERWGDIPVFTRLQRIKNLLSTLQNRFSFVPCLTRRRVAVKRFTPASSVK